MSRNIPSTSALVTSHVDRSWLYGVLMNIDAKSLPPETFQFPMGWLNWKLPNILRKLLTLEASQSPMGWLKWMSPLKHFGHASGSWYFPITEGLVECTSSLAHVRKLTDLGDIPITNGLVESSIAVKHVVHCCYTGLVAVSKGLVEISHFKHVTKMSLIGNTPRGDVSLNCITITDFFKLIMKNDPQ